MRMSNYNIDGTYTPDIQDMEDEYAFGKTEWSTLSVDEARAEFKRGLVEHDREVRAKAYEWVAADTEKIGGWAIGTMLTDLAAMERGEMTLDDIKKKWGRDA
jgi:hypothetical protein